MKWTRIRAGHYRLGVYEIVNTASHMWTVYLMPAGGWADAYPAHKGPFLIDRCHTLAEAKEEVRREINMTEHFKKTGLA